MPREPAKPAKAKVTTYTVGYLKPPREGQFKKGKSGNPRGRPKGARSFSTLLSQALMDKVVVKESGVRKSISKLEALITQMVNRAISGDARARQQTLGVMHIFEDTESPVSEIPNEPLDSAEKKILNTILDRLRQIDGQENEPEQS